MVLQVGTAQKTFLNVLLEKFCLLLNVLINFSPSFRHVEGDHTSSNFRTLVNPVPVYKLLLNKC